MKHYQLIGYYTPSRRKGHGCRGDRVQLSVAAVGDRFWSSLFFTSLFCLE
ncbi:hypothetical protein [Laspinema olomoucense]|nr:hypothetical protein [Laspinema sp. D3d]MCT7971958.1 hypothetical protein [Laspinema sp. D3d]